MAAHGSARWTLFAPRSQRIRISTSGAHRAPSARLSFSPPPTSMRAWFISISNTASFSDCSAVFARRASSTTISPAPASARPTKPSAAWSLLGRISLYGPGASRLHDEIIAVTARWIDPIARKGPLVPYAEDTEKLTLAALEKAFESARTRRVGEAVERKLQSAAPQDVADLLPHLQARAGTVTASRQSSPRHPRPSGSRGNAPDY